MEISKDKTQNSNKSQEQSSKPHGAKDWDITALSLEFPCDLCFEICDLLSAGSATAGRSTGRQARIATSAREGRQAGLRLGGDAQQPI
jgi:hypothetical protein